MVCGACWGVGAVMFGLAVNYVGMSITYGISMGLATVVGSLIPLARVEDVGSAPATRYVLLGVAVMVAGVAIVTHAGLGRV